MSEIVQVQSIAPFDWFRALMPTPGGSVRELRAIRDGGHIVRGFYDNAEDISAEAVRLSSEGYNVYYTVNPVRPETFAESLNQRATQGRATRDEDIEVRVWLFADIDARRVAGESATEDEHQHALRKALDIAEAMVARGWPEPAILSSGNGSHLYWQFDAVPNDERSTMLIKAALDGLAHLFDDEHAKVDRTVSNASRIARVPGTLTRKGTSTPERSHRVAGLVRVPSEGWHALTLRQLEEFAGLQLAKSSESDGEPANALAEIGMLRVAHRPSVEYLLTRAVAQIEMQGGRDNAAAKWLFPQMKDNGYTRSEAESIADEWHRRALEAKPGDGYALSDVYRAIRSVYKQAKREPWSQPVGQYSDLANAHRLISEEQDNLRCLSGGSMWVHWSDEEGRWLIDDTERVKALAQNIAVRLITEAGTIEDPKTRALAIKRAETCLADSRVEAMIRSARPHLSASRSEFDRDKFLLNVRNGTIDLRTGGIREHRRTDFLLKQCPVHYEPEAYSQEWEAFLQKVFGEDEQLIGFVQRVAGYTLTGSTHEELAFCVHGPGGSGKSTFVAALTGVLGDYSVSADFKSFLEKKFASGSGPSSDIARLAGARCVSAVETSRNLRLDAGLVKKLTGQDTITARRMRENEFEFVPHFKLFLVSNDAPAVDDDDTGLWRRLIRIPFVHVFAEGQRDPGAKDRICNLATTGPAILAWAVKGCLAWHKSGLQIPEKVRAATAAYRAEMNPLREFFEARCVIGTNAFVSSTKLYDEYAAWFTKTSTFGEKILAHQTFAKRVLEHPDIDVRHTKTGNQFVGVGLQLAPETVF